MPFPVEHYAHPEEERARREAKAAGQPVPTFAPRSYRADPSRPGQVMEVGAGSAGGGGAASPYNIQFPEMTMPSYDMSMWNNIYGQIQAMQQAFQDYMFQQRQPTSPWLQRPSQAYSPTMPTAPTRAGYQPQGTFADSWARALNEIRGMR